MESTAREIAMVLALALAGLLLAAVAVFAPWPAAEAAAVVVEVHPPR